MITNRDFTTTFYGATITIPKGTELVEPTPNQWAVASIGLIAKLSDNRHDAVHRYCYVPEEYVDHA